MATLFNNKNTNIIVNLFWLACLFYKANSQVYKRFGYFLLNIITKVW